MTRLLDFGIDRIRNIIMDMATLSEKSVRTAIVSYEKGTSARNQVFDWSEQLRMLQEEVSDLAIEILARYKPVESDLRLLSICLVISYGFICIERLYLVIY